MGAFNLWNKILTNIASITLSNTTILSHGLIQISGSIAGDSGGLTTVYTLPAGSPDLDPVRIKVECVGGSGISGPLVGSLGTGAAVDDIMPSTSFTGLTSPGLVWEAPLIGLVKRCVAGDVISFNISTPVTGTTPLYRVTIFGEYL
ncbi:MAG: hypothetical protein AB7O96_00810 [Pseudobdellovibrionaceae bacterium]